MLLVNEFPSHNPVKSFEFRHTKWRFSFQIFTLTFADRGQKVDRTFFARQLS